MVEYYNSGTEDGYKKFVPNKRKRREGTKKEIQYKVVSYLTDELKYFFSKFNDGIQLCKKIKLNFNLFI